MTSPLPPSAQEPAAPAGINISTVQAVLDAWTDPGPVPAYHQMMQYRLRTEWPVLAIALDAATQES